MSTWRPLNEITEACLRAAHDSIPHTSSHINSGRIPGWSEEAEPLRQKSLFWHKLWTDSGRPHNGAVVDCMRRIRVSYHYAIQHVRKNAEQIIRDRIVHSLLIDSSCNFWSEIRKNRNANGCTVVDGISDRDHVAELFATKYRLIQCNTIQHNTIQYNTTQYNKIQRNTIKYSSAQSTKT